jgi:hypothetical protein
MPLGQIRAIPCRIRGDKATNPDYRRASRAPVVKLVDAPHSKCGIERCAGSSPARGTKFFLLNTVGIGAHRRLIWAA